MDIIQKRFDELDSQGRKGLQMPSHDIGTQQFFMEWKTSVFSLLGRVFGTASPTYQEFRRQAEVKYLGSMTEGQNYSLQMRPLYGIFQSAKSDYEGGYLFDVQKLVHAEVFSDELEQAKYFLDLEHKIPAAVIAGTVLETTLRKLCESNGIDKMTDKGKNKMADAMISVLAKVPVFNKMVADQLRAWVKIRNSAAHGHPEEFDEGDVGRMIEGVRDFVAAQMS